MMGPISETESGCAGGSKFIAVPVVPAAGNPNRVSPRLMTMTDATTDRQHLHPDHDDDTPQPGRTRTAPGDGCAALTDTCALAGKKGPHSVRRSDQFASPRPPTQVTRETTHGLSGLRGGYMVAARCGDTVWTYLQTRAGQAFRPSRERRNHGWPVRLWSGPAFQ